MYSLLCVTDRPTLSPPQKITGPSAVIPAIGGIVDGESKNSEELKQIAQRGTRLDETIEGHGLGLAICKDIVSLYSGTIYFDPSEKLGAFSVEVII